MRLATDPRDPAFPTPADGASVALRERWFELTAAGLWTFQTDWHDPAVDALCEACLSGRNLWACAERLGAVRAAGGVGLAETLADVDALMTVRPDLPADLLCRAVSLGWADRTQTPAVAIIDPITGLASADYLRQRLREVYRAADVAGRRVSAGTALVVVRTSPTGTGWAREAPLIIAAHALRTVFDGGQTLARTSDRVALALISRDRALPRRVQLLGGVLQGLLPPAAPGMAAPMPRVWIEKLPDDLDAALDLVEGLGG